MPKKHLVLLECCINMTSMEFRLQTFEGKFVEANKVLVERGCSSCRLKCCVHSEFYNVGGIKYCGNYCRELVELAILLVYLYSGKFCKAWPGLVFMPLIPHGSAGMVKVCHFVNSGLEPWVGLGHVQGRCLGRHLLTGGRV